MKKMLIPIISISLLYFAACKKEEKTTNDKKDDIIITAPTLNKDNLIGKVWSTQGGGTEHHFKANGVYYTNGTWVWQNNSDSMIIKQSPTDTDRIWYFKYCQGDSLECKLSITGTWRKMRDHNW